MQPPQPLTIISVLGPPGSGKGTQCQRLTQDHPNEIKHISIGAMLREEMTHETSPYKKGLQENMVAGRLGPPEMTVGILKERLEGLEGVVLLDGFPRAVEPLRLFEKDIGRIERVVVIDCAEEVCLERLRGRARFDDRAGDANFRERMRTWREETKGVVEVFEQRGGVRWVDGSGREEDVGREFERAVFGGGWEGMGG